MRPAGAAVGKSGATCGAHTSGSACAAVVLVVQSMQALQHVVKEFKKQRAESSCMVHDGFSSSEESPNASKPAWEFSLLVAGDTPDNQRIY